jgi:hypothetical protein
MQIQSELYVGVFLHSIELLQWNVFFVVEASVGNHACGFSLQVLARA